MKPDMFRRAAGFSVDVVALATVALHPFPLYVVLLLYWADVVVGTLRQVAETVVAAPREAYSPTDPPAISRNGDPNPFRFLVPKLGTFSPVSFLPPIAVHNLKPGAVGVFAVSLSTLAVALTATVLDPQFAVGAWPTSGLLVLGGLTIVVKHGWRFRCFLGPVRRPATRAVPFTGWVASVLLALPVVAVDTVHGSPDVDPATGFAALAFVLVVGRVAYGARGESSGDGATPFELSEPTGGPTGRFRADPRAVRIGGVIDGLLPRLEWNVLNVAARVMALLTLALGCFLAAGAGGFDPVPSLVAGVTVAFVVAALAFGLAGVVHFALAFGAMEYRLSDEELVAYDTRLDAVQWRAPLDAVRAVSVERGLWTAPPGTDVAMVTLDRTDLDVEQSPYGFYRQTLAYVENPERVADRLRRATERREETNAVHERAGQE
ncbi:hypothetical protein [Haloarchaeobius sp. DYHT-AS-18]|uniref:hypothetical protein n=1 Tax=Haloarchaeobius sp. DYHT-AS-18 TaxID=3446117 RepID=UPI003EBF1414